MSVVVMLMMGGWIATLSMVGVCALHESGRLFKLRRRIALWLLETSSEQIRSAEKGFQAERGNAV